MFTQSTTSPSLPSLPAFPDESQDRRVGPAQFLEDPTANAWWRRRTASMVRVQFSSDVEGSRCASTLTAW
ncbi:hypothetical protein BZL30_9417 [Mycobacterium kansasii]|uniref:Uncharacterized protein n=1 Tax=Mycobacterium kansasii TaxID=1768 RepID=A0A1V3WB30_MYCKA|nr:hypothetical protein BZL30_9417 [Mycobacterium kansasii]